jgi:hypothetical protein
MSKSLSIVIVCTIASLALVAYSAARRHGQPVKTLTTYEACKYAMPDGQQGGCEPSAPDKATRVTTRHN